MAFTKITSTELNSRGATTLPNQPTISASALKQEFDAPAKNVVAPKVNNLIDELEAGTAAASLGAVAPSGRIGSTVQAVLNSVSGDLATLETNAAPAITNQHTHSNKSLLDTYSQTDSDLTDAVSKKHSHSNKTVIDKLSDQGGDLYYDGSPIGGGGTTDYSSLTNKPSINNVSLSGNKTLAELGIPTALSALTDDSSHRTVSDTEKSTWNAKQNALTAGTNITIEGNTISASSGTVDNAFKKVKVGTTEITASGEDTIEIKAGTNVTITPDAVNKTVTINSSGGGGGGSTGDMLKSVYDTNNDGIVNSADTLNGLTATVAELNYVDGVTGAIQTQLNGKQATLTFDNAPTQNSSNPVKSGGVYTALAGKADSSSLASVATSGQYADLSGAPTLASVATSGDYSDLINKPNIPAAQVNSDWDSSSGVSKILNKPNLATVATSGSYADLSNTPSLATVATSGSYTDLSNKPTIPTVDQSYGSSSTNAQSGTAVAEAISSKLTGKVHSTKQASSGTPRTVTFTGLDATKDYFLEADLGTSWNAAAPTYSNIQVSGSGTNVSVIYTLENANSGQNFRLIEIG